MDFYVFKSILPDGGKVVFDVADEHTGATIVDCSHLGVRGIQPGRKNSNYEVELVITDVADVNDFASAFTTKLASRRVRDVVHEHGLRGVRFHEIIGYQIETKKSGVHDLLSVCQDEKEYMVMEVFGDGGSVLAKSGISREKYCAICDWEEWSSPKSGVYVDEKQWDGSDFFHVREFGALLMSQRAVTCLRKSKLTGWDAVKAVEIRSLN